MFPLLSLETSLAAPGTIPTPFLIAKSIKANSATAGTKPVTH